MMSRDDAMAQMDEYKEQLEDYGMDAEQIAQLTTQGQGSEGSQTFDGSSGGAGPGDEL